MFRNIMSIAVASLLSVLAVMSVASAGEPAKANLGPVGPNEPILATVGDSRLIARFRSRDGNCAVNAVMFSTSANSGGYKSKSVDVTLHPGELFHFGGMKNERVVMTCGPNAKVLTVLNRGEILTKSASSAQY